MRMRCVHRPIAKDASSDLHINVTPEVNALTVVAEVDVTGYCESDYPTNRTLPKKLNLLLYPMDDDDAAVYNREGAKMFRQHTRPKLPSQQHNSTFERWIQY
ncbi:hypothetical protein DUI87_07351 [Hirundo rustica rustica]|uniref:Uncharacterized protein n=1 Tax=Hirundo rustica rustica TaxID=333673 RepID=A0A3M0KPJ8_HIRRU|nr:hypothetical protein DUI87_07351 [Hirundo rustica rustica]